MKRISAPTHRRHRRALALTLSSLLATGALAQAPSGFGVVGSDGQAARVVNNDASRAALHQAIAQVTAMPQNPGLQLQAQRVGLNVINVLWEDTGRFAGSSVGPNISDVTLQLREPVDGQGTFRSHLLPVLRYPNFSDTTADVAADKLWVRVGNQSAGSRPVTVPLTEVLKHLREYVSNPESVVGSGDFSAPRDSHMLVSAQHVFVPIPKEGKIEFTPVIFNYQSYQGNPAVLTLLVTRQGLSMAAIENNDAGGAGYGGQQLYFNNQGQKTTLTAERKSAIERRINSGQAQAQDEGALDDGADMMLIIQVPLKQREIPGRKGCANCEGVGTGGAMPMSAPSVAMEADAKAGSAARSDVEQAVLGHGDDLGPVTEGHQLSLERDPRFPVRVTVQFYKATSNGVVSEADLKSAKAQIDKVYAKGDYVGSLVVPEGQRHRPTDWYLGKTTVTKAPPTPVPPMPVPTPVPLTGCEAIDCANGPCVVDESGPHCQNVGLEVPAPPKPSLWQRLRTWLWE